MTDSDTTTLDNLLRAVADRLPDNPALAEQVVGRGLRRRARTRAVAVVAGVAVVAATAVALVAVNPTAPGHSGGVNRITIDNTPPPAHRAPTTAGKPTSQTPTRPGTRETFGRLSYTLPPGWKVLRDYAHGPQTLAGSSIAAGEEVCIGPGRQSDQGPCAGIELDRGGFPGRETTQFVAHQPGGWYAGTGVSPCPVNPTAGGFNGMQMGLGSRGLELGPVEQGTRRLGALTYDYDQWLGHCDDGFAFTPQAWSLPVSGYRILDLLSHPGTEALLRGITLR